MLPLALAPALLALHLTPLPSPQLDDLFPRANAPLILDVPDDGSEYSIADLLDDYGALTDQRFELDADTKTLLEQHKLHLTRELEVPVEEVQSYVETILIENHFVLRILKADGIRLLGISSLASAARNNLRSHAMFVPEDSLSLAEAHPAMLFSTTISMPHCDTRQLSNSMRTIITDANTQQLLPAGNENVVVLLGIGGSFVNTAKILHAIEDRAADNSVEPALEVIALENGNAAALASLLSGLLDLNAAAPQQPGVVLAPRTKVMPDERTNSLVIRADPVAMARLKKTIAALDR